MMMMKTFTISIFVVVCLALARACEDKHENCGFWQKNGECEEDSYKIFMKANCEKSCGFCTETTENPLVTPDPSNCLDEREECPRWAQSGRCTNLEFIRYMQLNCKRSCGACNDQKTTLGTKKYCVDKNTHCEAWAKDGHCVDQQFERFMTANCQKSCDTCNDVATATTTTTTTTTTKNPATKAPSTTASPVTTSVEPCVDKQKLCGYWYLIGECANNAGYMTTNCQRSCGICTDGKSILGCSDSNNQCAYWASIGECQNNKGFMLMNCRVSCKACNPDPGPPTATATVTTKEGKCEDKSVNCPTWSKIGECAKSPIYMNAHCPASCNKC